MQLAAQGAGRAPADAETQFSNDLHEPVLRAVVDAQLARLINYTTSRFLRWLVGLWGEVSVLVRRAGPTPGLRALRLARGLADV